MIDQYGLYVQADGDGGDCPHRCGIMLAYFATTTGAYRKLITNIYKYLEPGKPLEFIRYPDKWNDPKDFSRDQASRLMLGLGMSKETAVVRDYYRKVIENGCKHPNGDYLGTGEPGNIIRLLNMWYLYPALLFLDVKFLFDLISRKIIPWGYDALFLPDLYYSKIKYPTPAVWLTIFIYKFFFKNDVEKQIRANLIDSENNPCVEAGGALLTLFGML